MDAKRIRELLDYDAESGCLLWRVGRHGRRIGEEAGSTCTNGYRKIKLDGRYYLAHRIAWAHVTGSFPTDQLDHINGVRNDNRLANLREATGSQNQQHKNRRQANNTTGFTGVCVDRGRFKAAIHIPGSGIKNLGRFGTPEEAHAAYLHAKAVLHPFWIPDD